jgi:predicted DNA-binding transcriptional regulator AlpA
MYCDVMASAHDHPRTRRHRLTHRESSTPRLSNTAGGPTSLLTIAEVLAELQVARSTFDTWRSLGSAPECIKLPNGQIRIRRCALDSWLASHSDKEAS